MYNLTSRRIHETTADVEKQLVLHISLWVGGWAHIFVCARECASMHACA
jgi:hypothetical protein